MGSMLSLAACLATKQLLYVYSWLVCLNRNSRLGFLIKIFIKALYIIATVHIAVSQKCLQMQSHGEHPFFKNFSRGAYPQPPSIVVTVFHTMQPVCLYVWDTFPHIQKLSRICLANVKLCLPALQFSFKYFTVHVLSLLIFVTEALQLCL